MDSDISGNILLSINKEKRLGSGRFCVVFLGAFTILSQSTKYPCAVKRLLKHNENSEQDLIDPTYSLKNEISILQKLSKAPFTIKCIGVVDESTMKGKLDFEAFESVFNEHLSNSSDSLPFADLLLLEYAPNGDLMDIVEKKPHLLTRASIWKWTFQICSALEALREVGIVHHDLKPQNLLLDASFNVKLNDFGNAMVCPEEGLEEGLGKGTLGYTAPEIFYVDRRYSFPIDVYSLGVIMYVLITCETPYSNVTYPPMTINYIKKGFWSFHRPPGYQGDLVVLGSKEELLDDDILIGIMIACADKEPKARPVPKRIKELLAM